MTFQNATSVSIMEDSVGNVLMPGDIVFALGALVMAWDFLIKLPPLLRPSAAPRADVGTLSPEEVG